MVFKQVSRKLSPPTCTHHLTQLLPRAKLVKPGVPYRVVPVAARVEDGLDSRGAVRGVSRLGGDEAAEHLLAAGRLAPSQVRGATAEVIPPARK